MRRRSRLASQRGFRSSDWRQIVSMLGMLVLLYLAWDVARQPSTWRWLANDAGADDSEAHAAAAPPKHALDASKSNAAATAPAPAKTPPPSEAEKKDAAPAPPPAAEPAAKGPTDEDPDERAGAENEFQAITDKTLTIQPEEMFAYRRMVQWVVNQPADVLRKRARTDVTFHDFMTSPDKYRGVIVELQLDASLILSTEWRANDGRTDLYEVWGPAANSGSWLYDAVVVGLPQGMPVGKRITERVRFVGYFFKLLGYYEAGAKPRAAPLVAPVLIGRLVWIQAPPLPSNKSDPVWTAVAIAGLGLVVGLHFLWLLLRSKRRRVGTMKPIGNPSPVAPGMDQWLDQIESGATPTDDAESVVDDDFQEGPRKPASSGQATGEPSSHPLDGGNGDGG